MRNFICGKRPCRRTAPLLVQQSGQSSMEYTVVCAALAFALLVPLRDAASPDRTRTTVEILLEGLVAAYEKFSFAISLPT